MSRTFSMPELAETVDSDALVPIMPEASTRGRGSRVVDGALTVASSAADAARVAVGWSPHGAGS